MRTSSASSIGTAYARLGRYAEAGTALDRARSLRPSSTAIGYLRARLAASRGDLAGVREETRRAEGFAARRRTLAYWALRENTLFALDVEQQKTLMSLTPADLDGGKADWGLALAETSWLRGNGAQARSYGEVAAAGYAQLLETWAQAGDREQVMMLRAYGLALAGRMKESIVIAEQAMSLERQVGLRNAYLPFIFARIYVLVNRPEPAIDQLEEMINRRDFYSRSWLRIDGTFAPLRTNPRFQRLVSGAPPS